MDQTQTTPRLIPGAEVRARTSLSRATIWRRVREGQFPAPVRLGSNKIAWLESAVTAWIEGHSSTAEGQ